MRFGGLVFGPFLLIFWSPFGVPFVYFMHALGYPWDTFFFVSNTMSPFTLQKKDFPVKIMID